MLEQYETCELFDCFLKVILTYILAHKLIKSHHRKFLNSRNYLKNSIPTEQIPIDRFFINNSFFYLRLEVEKMVFCDSLDQNNFN